MLAGDRVVGFDPTLPSNEADGFDDDFFVQKLGGPDAVRGLRYAISEGLRF